MEIVRQQQTKDYRYRGTGDCGGGRVRGSGSRGSGGCVNFTCGTHNLTSHVLRLAALSSMLQI